MNLLGSILVLAVTIAVLRLVFSPPVEFMIRILRESPRVTKGKVTRDFLQQLAAICRERGIERGWVGGARRGRRLALRFSRNIPRDCRQQIRNLWTNQ